jgi:hypothetical protein
MRLRIGDMGRVRASELDWPIVAKRTIAVYEETLAKRAGRRNSQEIK